jgi:hypothetical protein
VNLRRTWTILLACGATALLVIVPAATAKPEYVVVPGDRAIDLNLKGSNGYSINVVKEGRYVQLLATDRKNVVIYSTPSLSPKGNEIKARFPGVGRVSMRFHPKGPPHEERPEPIPPCKGGEVVKQPGYFEGTIRFRGERGYTSASATRVRAARETRAKEVCKFPGAGPGSKADKTEFYASSRSGKRLVAFDASRLVLPGGDPLTTFGASVAERRRGMIIYRSTFLVGGVKDLVPGDTRPYPLSGTFAPPAPFQGSGEFQRDAEGNSTWSGSLTVPLPGLPPLALTGPDFTARFCQHSGCTGNFIDGHSLPLGQLRALAAVE